MPIKISFCADRPFGSNNQIKEHSDYDTDHFASFALLAFFGIATGAAIAQPFAYVANATSHNISGYAVDQVTGALTRLAGSPFPAGNLPQSVAATPSGKFVYAPNSTDSTISAYSLDGTSGALTQITGSPFTTGSYPFGVAISPSGKFLYTANVSGNTISAFSIDGATGTLTPLSGSPFAAGPYPQDLAFSPSGKFVYVSNSSGGTVSAFAVNSDRSLTQVGPLYAAGLYPDMLAVSPSGFLYVPNDNSGTISVYSINAASGALTPISGSPFPGPGQPTQAAVAPSGQILYVSGGNSNDIAAYRINRTTGALTPISGSSFPGGGAGLFSVAISSSDQFLYTADENSFQISGYSINATTGALTPLAGSPFAGDGSYPDFVTLVNPAVKTCGALDVSAEATLTPGPYTHQLRTDLWDESLTITNGITPITGPLSVVLLGLPSSTTTLSGTYTGLSTTYCYSAAGNYVVPIDALLAPGNNHILLPDEVLSVPFVFASIEDGVTLKPTGYKAKLISGTLNK
jgi:6-phosphogluconolactonase